MPARTGSEALRKRNTLIGNLAKDSANSIKKLAELELIYSDNQHRIVELNQKISEKASLISELKDNITSLSDNIFSFREQMTKSLEEIESLRLIISDQNKEKKKLRYRISSGNSIKSDLSKSITNLVAQKVLKRVHLKRRLEVPTGPLLSERSKRRRVSEIFTVCKAINGGSEDILPVIDGMLLTLSSKCTSSVLVPKLLGMKPAVTKLLKQSVLTEHCNQYYHSNDNLLRSLNMYYCNNVLGKNKYISIKRANKRKGIPNVVPYEMLSKHIREIDIGELIPIEGTLDINVDDDNKGIGYYRNLRTYLPRLAQFYLSVDKNRIDKLIHFDCVKIKSSSMLFLFSIGGDEAPSAGTSFLVSFLNAGKRVCSSFENFLIFAGNVKENGIIIERYLEKLLIDIKYLESRTFEVMVDNERYDVEFKLELLPNDMKMLAFLAGELTNAAHHFLTFANVNKENVQDLNRSFNSGKENDWMPFSYKKREEDAQLVKQRKEQLKLSTKKLAPTTLRNKITTYIKSLNSRQEFLPRVGVYVDKALAEPLHIKNNVCKEFFLKVWRVVVAVADVSTTIKIFKNIPEDNLLHIFVKFVSKSMKSNKLGKKLKEWFNETRDRQSDFAFRFRGEESRNYLIHFPVLIEMLCKKISVHPEYEKWRKRLVVIFIQSIFLRQLISFTVRVTDICQEDLLKMKSIGIKLFKLHCIHESGPPTPSLWTLCIITPVHSKTLFEKVGLGLGANTMEGREQKHQKIKKYMENSTIHEQWGFVFRHEFISCIYLRQYWCDQIRYNKKINPYVPLLKDGHCSCGLQFSYDKVCGICDSDEFTSLLNFLENV